MKNDLIVKEIDFFGDFLIAAKDKQKIGQVLNGSVMGLGYQMGKSRQRERKFKKIWCFLKGDEI